MKRYLIFFLAMILGFSIISLTPFVTVFAADKWNLGMVDSSASKMNKRFGSFLKYLASQGIATGKVITTKNFSQMIKMFNDGKVDFMFESANGALQVMDGSGATPLLIREKGGNRQYNSVIFVKKDSPIKTLTDLKGKVIAFEDSGSTSSFLLPKSILEEAGLSLKESRKPVSGKVAYYFSKDDSNTIAQVKAGKRAQAGGIKATEVLDNSAFRLLEPQSVFVPRHAVIVRKGLDSSKLKEVLLNMKKDPGAKEVLKTMRTPTGFSEFDKDPIESMNEVREALGM